MINPKLIDQIKRHEGLRLRAYQDSLGVWTCGYGRNLQELEIDEHQANKWLLEDLWKAKQDLLNALPFTRTMDSVRQDALVNMSFNLGITRLKGFKKMLAALEEGDYERAASEVLDSNYAKQVGSRAIEIAAQIRNGCYGKSD